MLQLARTARSALVTIGARLASPRDWLPSLRAAASWLATPSGAPHFVRDYRKMVADLVLANGAAAAMELGVGGHFEAIGQAQTDLLLRNGLQPTHRVIDVGCGSGHPAHWPIFASTVENIRLQQPWPANAFLTADIMTTFAQKLGLTVERMLTGAEAPALGQSVAVWRKPER